MYPVGCRAEKKRKRHALVTRSGPTSVPQKKVLENIPTVATSKRSWYRHRATLRTKGTPSLLGGSVPLAGRSHGGNSPTCHAVRTTLGAP